MDFFFCLPVIFGCPTKIKPDSDGAGSRICPRCHNASVIPAKSRTWIEICFVPLIPMNSKHVWICGICNWEVDQGGWEPALPNQGPPPGQWQQQGQWYPPPQNYGQYGGPGPQQGPRK